MCWSCDQNLIQISFYYSGVPPYKLLWEEKSWGWFIFFLIFFMNLKEGAIIAAKWKYVLGYFQFIRTPRHETTTLKGSRNINHILGKFKNKLVPVFFTWQRLSFAFRRIISKLIIFRFIKDLICHWNSFITLPTDRCLELGPEHSLTLKYLFSVYPKIIHHKI